MHYLKMIWREIWKTVILLLQGSYSSATPPNTHSIVQDDTFIMPSNSYPDSNSILSMCCVVCFGLFLLFVYFLVRFTVTFKVRH